MIKQFFFLAFILLSINHCYSQDSTNILTNDTIYKFEDVEVKPSFPNGENAMVEFIQSNLKYPKEAKNLGKQGYVYVLFVVFKNGDVGKVRILKDIGSGTSKAVKTLINKMPKWKPGYKNGRAVDVRFVLPIYFYLK